MSCTNPVLAVNYGPHLNDNGDYVDYVKILRLKPGDNLTNLKIKYGDLLMPLPCGKCLACREEKAKNWMIRCYLESLEYGDNNCFLTLTYDEASNPGQLVKKDIQTFIKSLRNAGYKFRYFLCGEYGSHTLRPHYHMLMFGFIPGDLEALGKSGKGSNLFTSKLIKHHWPFGIHTVGLLTPETVAYTCRYTMKKITDHYIGADSFQKEFILMSRRPGLGRSYIEKHKDELLKNECFYLGDFGIKGFSRYVKDILNDYDPWRMDEILQKNKKLAISINNTKKYVRFLSHDEELLKEDSKNREYIEKRKRREY